MATTTLSTDSWVESSSSAGISTDAWVFTLSATPEVTVSSDRWGFSLTPVPTTTVSSDRFATGFYAIGDTLSQVVHLVQNTDYRLSYKVTVSGTVAVEISTYSHSVSDASVTVLSYFTHLDVDGDYAITFYPVYSATPTTISVDAVSLKATTAAVVDDNLSVKEFLSGAVDDGAEIPFRVDTQVLQIQPSPEMYSNPIAIATELERGTMMKAFVSLDDKPFYEVEGTVTKGVSIVKLNTVPNGAAEPPLAQTIQVSYRDSSKQLCRILQTAVITMPTPIDHSP